MGPLPRFARIALASSLLLALTSLPAIPANRVSGSGIAPTVAWASGSPDETLKPPTPPHARSTNNLDRTSSWKEFRSALARLKGADRWEFVYRIIQASTQRF